MRKKVYGRCKMAPHSVAAAQCFFGWCFVWLFGYVLFQVLSTFCWVNIVYSWHNLLKIGVCYKQSVTGDFLHSHKIPVETARSIGSLWIIVPTVRRRRGRRERKQKQGCRASALARLRRQPLRPPLPSLFLPDHSSLVFMSATTGVLTQ